MVRIDGRRDHRARPVTAVSGDRPLGPPAGSGLSKGVSLYIDLLRLVAALLVFVGHADTLLFDGRIPPIVSHHAREAVAIFFVLSGFVISFAARNRERSLRNYIVARTSRIVPVVLVSLGVTLVCDQIGYAFNSSYYDQLRFFSPASLTAALSYLTFTNQIWFNHIVFGTNEPFWSLSFEVWYYILFALVMFSSGWMRIVLVALAAVVCGPLIVMYLPLWLLGALLYLLYERGLRVGLSALALFPLSVCCYQLARRHLGGEASDIFHIVSPAHGAYNVAYFCLIGLLACVNILSGGEITQRLLPYLAGVAKAVRWASGASFTLYLVHLPILIMLRAVFPATGASWIAACLACVTTIGLVLLLAELGERRKRQLAGALAGLIRRAGPRTSS